MKGGIVMLHRYSVTTKHGDRLIAECAHELSRGELAQVRREGCEIGRMDVYVFRPATAAQATIVEQAQTVRGARR